MGLWQWPRGSHGMGQWWCPLLGLFPLPYSFLHWPQASLPDLIIRDQKYRRVNQVWIEPRSVCPGIHGSCRVSDAAQSVGSQSLVLSPPLHMSTVQKQEHAALVLCPSVQHGTRDLEGIRMKTSLYFIVNQWPPSHTSKCTDSMAWGLDTGAKCCWSDATG